MQLEDDLPAVWHAPPRATISELREALAMAAVGAAVADEAKNAKAAKRATKKERTRVENILAEFEGVEGS